MHFGTTSKRVECPYCGERFEAVIDCSESEQSYIEDCWVCCRPISFTVYIDEQGEANVYTRHENEC